MSKGRVGDWAHLALALATHRGLAAAVGDHLQN